ncbi:helix-hairpin-helix domain-containing protein [Flavobacterium silvisoli]|uniref:Helix-hairpin-helix domain-containing protein n=1 Tax=Flavobacterium silvisoli TaxID=2529433 RepID=A0A4Q9YTL6_9FLAO|nr:helix-hairpin-helix domain-containing protein [Flavobacterium silvisoli]
MQTVLQYTKSQRLGLVLLFVLILILQGVYFFVDFKTETNSNKAAATWLAEQKEIDSLKVQSRSVTPVIYPFNPNYITDFKGYKLGMSTAEIDRLLAYRKQNKFVNSAAEFQTVTGVSDSLLKTLSPFFKFPDWVTHRKTYPAAFVQAHASKNEKTIVLDINKATKEELMKLYGIGDKISDRILEQREKLGSFVSMEQLQDVWGLSPEVLEQLNRRFAVQSTPQLKKININTASVKELSQSPFFRYALAKELVIYRTMHGSITVEDLPKIKGFPVDQIQIIALYLEF